MLAHITKAQIGDVIALAQALNAKHPPKEEGVEWPTDSRPYLADRKDLVNGIAALSQEARVELMAVMWLGRDWDGTFDEAVKYARDNSDPGDVGYIADKSPALPTYLTRGLARI